MQRAPATWASLPEDIVGVIFSYLDIRDRGRTSQGTPLA